MSKHTVNFAIDKELFNTAFKDSFKKLSPKEQIKNKVMFLVYVGAIFITILSILSVFELYSEDPLFCSISAVVLWFTVLFANFAEAIAQSKAKAQAQSLRSIKKKTVAHRLVAGQQLTDLENLKTESLDAINLKKDDMVLVKAGEMIPCDGQVVAGLASVNESAITGESAPVIRGAGCDTDSVTGGTTVLSDIIVIRVVNEVGSSFLDKMIGMVEGAVRKKTPNEVALSIVLLCLTIIFTLVTLTLLPFSDFAREQLSYGSFIGYSVIIVLLVCLIPTTIGSLLSAIGIAGMSRLLMCNVIAKSGHAVEAAGDVDVLLLDKTGTITYGNRQANKFFAADGIMRSDMIRCSLLASLSDTTPEGRSIVTLAKKEGFNDKLPENAAFVPFSATSCMSGVNIDGVNIKKGSPKAVFNHVKNLGGRVDDKIECIVNTIASLGSTPLVVCRNETILGVIELKDIVKSGLKERFLQLRKMGIKTVMVTGDNELTAAAIAAEAGVDDFIAAATPELKLETIRNYQKKGHLVAMTGDGTNDAPALAQADVAVAMNAGTQSAREAANMVDLDSSPTKLLDVVKIGKQMLITRGALTTFSIANDLAKFFAVIPAAFVTTYPQLEMLNIMHLSSAPSALLSAVIFNALIIIALIPLALHGVNFKSASTKKLLFSNIMIYGIGGLIVPFIGIKLIDMVLCFIGIF